MRTDAMLASEELSQVTFCGGTAPYVPAVRETSEYEREDEDGAAPVVAARPGGRVMVIGFRVIRI